MGRSEKFRTLYSASESLIRNWMRARGGERMPWEEGATGGCRVTNNAVYVQKAPTLQPSVGTFLVQGPLAPLNSNQESLCIAAIAVTPAPSALPAST